MLPTVITEIDCQDEEQHSLLNAVSSVIEKSSFFVLDRGSVGQARLLMIDDKRFWKLFGGVLQDTIDSSLSNLLTFYVKDAILLADKKEVIEVALSGMFNRSFVGFYFTERKAMLLFDLTRKEG